MPHTDQEPLYIRNDWLGKVFFRAPFFREVKARRRERIEFRQEFEARANRIASRTATSFPLSQT